MTIALTPTVSTAVSTANAGTDGTRESGGLQAILNQFSGNPFLEWTDAAGVTLATQAATATLVTSTRPNKLRFELLPTSFTFVQAGTVASLRIKAGTTLVATNSGQTLSGNITASTTGVEGVFWLENSATLDAPAPMTITNNDSTTWTNQGVGHMVWFMPGQIPNYPEALTAGGTAYTTQQCDVLQRHVDGSVRMAMMHIVIPTLAAGASVTPKYQNKATSNNTPLTVAQMTAAGFDFDCELRLNAGGAGLSAKARTILSAVSDATLASNTAANSPDSRYIYKGPVCTTVLLADHSTKAYDIGAEATKSVRPWFVAKFWAHDNSWEVSVNWDTCDSTKLQNCTHSTTILKGNTTPTSVFTASSGVMYRNKKRSKRFFKGTQPKVGLKPNLVLMGSTVLPQYDPAFTLDATYKTSIINAWAAATVTFDGAGLWRQYMGATAAAAEIGMMSQWDAAMLYDGGWQLRDIVEQNLELAGAWPMWLRIGSSTRSSSTRYYDDQALVAGLGRWQSRDAFPNQGWVSYSADAWASPDNCTLIGSSAIDGVWLPDTAHCPDMGHAAYLLTGDYRWLDNLYGLLGWSVGYLVNGTGTGTIDPWSYQSGRDARDCPLNNQQVRQNAWVLRMRAYVLNAAPDGTPEKVYARRTIDTGMQAVLGKVASTVTNGNVVHDWFFTNRPATWKPYSVGYMSEAAYTGGGLGYPRSPDSAAGMAPWMHHFWTNAVSYTAFVDPTITSVQTAQTHFTKFGRTLALSAKPSWGQAYIYPALLTSTGDFAQSHAEAQASDSTIGAFSWTDPSSITADNDGYRNQYSATIAQAATLSSSSWKAWKSVLKPNVYDVETWTDGLKWAIIPRG